MKLKIKFVKILARKFENKCDKNLPNYFFISYSVTRLCIHTVLRTSSNNTLYFSQWRNGVDNQYCAVDQCFSSSRHFGRLLDDGLFPCLFIVITDHTR